MVEPKTQANSGCGTSWLEPSERNRRNGLNVLALRYSLICCAVIMTFRWLALTCGASLRNHSPSQLKADSSLAFEVDRRVSRVSARTPTAVSQAVACPLVDYLA